jgi:hypothetical protein
MKGSPDIVSAAETPTMATMSGSFSKSWVRTVQMTWVSFWKPLAKSGLIGLSIRRDVRVSFSLGRPSRLKKPPGILPAEKVFSW